MLNEPGCFAPSEVPGVKFELSDFGKIAERLVHVEFMKSYSPLEVYVDDNNLLTYLYFIGKHAPRLLSEDFVVSSPRPDFLVHSFAEKAFYEVKPNSKDGLKDGKDKIEELSVIYDIFKLPYKPGTRNFNMKLKIATYPSLIEVYFNATLIGPGLITYKICIEGNKLKELDSTMVLLNYIIKKIAAQKNSKTFVPVNLTHALSSEGDFSSFSKKLGIAFSSGLGATVGWKYFWKAVVKRYALRGTVAAGLSAADGPLPLGEILALGMGVFTMLDIILSSDQLWNEATKIRNDELS